MPDQVENCYHEHIADRDAILAMKAKHKILATYKYEPTVIERGYNNRSLYISVGGDLDVSCQDTLTDSVNTSWQETSKSPPTLI